ncbi:MAG: flavoprotein [Sporomusaceae bacterium]|nr:flavoprotein [Sporomusaceae bacterium]
MDNERLVQFITAEVMRQLGQMPLAVPDKSTSPCRQALVIFTGGTIGLEQSLVELQKIQALHIEVSVVLSAAAEQIIGVNRIKEHLGNNINLVTIHSPYPGKLLREADFVLVPVLTQNTAAKLAYTLSDTLPSTLIMQALMLGKPVLAAMNAADPQDGWRIKKDMGKCPPALSEALRQNLKKIESYGIELVHVKDLAAGSQKILNNLVKQTVPVSQGKRSVIDAEAIKAAAGDGRSSITVSKWVIITPLARDVAKEYGIEIVHELS